MLWNQAFSQDSVSSCPLTNMWSKASSCYRDLVACPLDNLKKKQSVLGAFSIQTGTLQMKELFLNLQKKSWNLWTIIVNRFHDSWEVLWFNRVSLDSGLNGLSWALTMQSHCVVLSGNTWSLSVFYTYGWRCYLFWRLTHQGSKLWVLFELEFIQFVASVFASKSTEIEIIMR